MYMYCNLYGVVILYMSQCDCHLYICIPAITIWGGVGVRGRTMTYADRNARIAYRVSQNASNVSNVW